jgi:hypothetical protein
MMISRLLPALILASALVNTANAQHGTHTTNAKYEGKLQYDDEKHFKNVRQLTFGGDNAEAYFGLDGNHLPAYQSERRAELRPDILCQSTKVCKR